MLFTEIERSLVVQALHEKADGDAARAKQMATQNQARLAEQFTRQSEQARALADRFER